MSYTFISSDALRQLPDANAEVNVYRSPTERYWMNVAFKDHPEKVMPEMHDRQADVYIALEGEGDLYLGGTMVNPTVVAPGQNIAERLDGAEKRVIRAGDFVIIPEGTPHMLDTRNGQLKLVIFKVDLGENFQMPATK